MLNENRKGARRLHLMSGRITEAMAERPPQEAPPPDAAEVASAMEECLQELPAESRELLRRRYQNEENATVLSEALTGTSTSARTRTARAGGTSLPSP